MNGSFKPLRLIMVYFGTANSFAFQPIVDNQMKENSFIFYDQNLNYAPDGKFFELIDFSEMKKNPIRIIFINKPSKTFNLMQKVFFSNLDDSLLNYKKCNIEKLKIILYRKFKVQYSDNQIKWQIQKIQKEKNYTLKKISEIK